MAKKFIRQESSRHSKIGKGRRKLQKWRKPIGRDSKIRLNRRDYPAKVKIGYKQKSKPQAILVSNLSSLENLQKSQKIILSARLGARKKIELIKKSQALGLQIQNLKGEKNETRK
jgi:large subunit ribosomal protein L32e